MLNKRIQAEIRLLKSSDGHWGIEISEKLKEDKGLRLAFISMIVDEQADEFGIPIEDFAKAIAENAKNNPMNFP